MLDLYVQSALLSAIGGGIFSVCANILLPFFDIPRIAIRETMIFMSTLAIIFWTTWMMPQVVLLTLRGLDLTIILILTAMFMAFLLGMLSTTLVIGRYKGANGGEKDG